MNIFYDPHLIEEAVFHAQHDRGDSERFDQRRNQIYEIADPDERDRQFNELNRSWFDRLKLGEVIEQCLSEQPLIAAHVERCFVVGASQAKEEGAELFVAPDEAVQDKERRTLRLLTRPESLVNKRRHFAAGVLTPPLTKGDVQPPLETPFDGSTPISAWPTIKADPLRNFLRRELFHVADMLDPAFAYEPTLPKADGGPTYDTLITNRYRVLWDVTIAGRMLRRGWCDGVVQEQQYGEFLRGFPMLKEKTEELFAKFFAAEEPRHAELAAFAFDPRKAGDALVQHAAPGTHCPLCKFPTHSFEPQPEQLGVETLRAIAGDFPNWQPALGLCSQCADLYRARQLSLAALHALPGWNASGKESFRA